MALKNRLGEMLLKAGVLNEAALKQVNEQHERWGGRFTKVLADLNLTDESDVTRALSAGLNVKQVDLSSVSVDKAALSRMDAAFAEQHGVFPVALKESGHSLQLAMADPSDLSALDAAAVRAKARILPVLAGERELARAISKHYRGVDLSTLETPKPVRPGGEDGVPETAEGFDASGAFMLPSRTQAAAPDEPDRLEQLRENQRKTAAVLRAVTELLEEKGYLPR